MHVCMYACMLERGSSDSLYQFLHSASNPRMDESSNAFIHQWNMYSLTHIHIHTYTYIHIHTHTYIHIHTQTKQESAAIVVMTTKMAMAMTTATMEGTYSNRSVDNRSSSTLRRSIHLTELLN